MREKSRAVGRAAWMAAATLAAAAMLVAPLPAQASRPLAIPVWSPGPTQYDFGVLDAGAEATKSVTFTLTNQGGASTGTEWVAVTNTAGSAFSLTGDHCSGLSLAPTKSCTVTVSYAPGTAGEADAATLAMTAEHARASLALTGQAGSPSLSWSPASFDFGSVTVGDSGTHSFTLTNSGDGTSGALTSSLTGSNALSIGNDTCTGATLAPGGTCSVTVAYVPTQGGTDSGTLAAGGATASLSGTGAAAAPLTVTAQVTDCAGNVQTTLDPAIENVVDGSADNCLLAQVDNAPAAGVDYQWSMTNPNGPYRFNPIQTTASVLLPVDSVPDFGRLDVVVNLTVTPKDGGAAVTTHYRVGYRFSALTLVDETCIAAKPADVTPQASASTIPVSGSLTISQSYVDNRGGDCGGAGVPISGTVTYSADGQSLGSSTAPLDPFVIGGSTLGAGSHVVTVTYAIWNGIAYAPYSVDVPVDVTP